MSPWENETFPFVLHKTQCGLHTETEYFVDSSKCYFPRICARLYHTSIFWEGLWGDGERWGGFGLAEVFNEFTGNIYGKAQNEYERLKLQVIEHLAIIY